MIPDTDLQKLHTLSRAVKGGTLDPERLAERAYCMGSIACHQALENIPSPTTGTFNLAELEKQTLQKAYEKTGDLSAAAKLMGIGKTTAYRKAKEYGIVSHLVCPNCHRPIGSEVCAN
jgi:transcriptional regulator of acetoin/glycerol metabolism